MKSKRSRLLIMAIADKLNEKEMEILKVNTTFAEMILNRKKIFVELYLPQAFNYDMWLDHS